MAEWGASNEVRYTVGEATVEGLMEAKRAECEAVARGLIDWKVQTGGFNRGVRAAADAIAALKGKGERTMAKQSPTFRDFNPTGDGRVALIKGKTDELIAIVKEESAAFGPEGQRRAALAVTAYEEASMWAVKALFSEDALRGDDGGAGS